MAERRPRDMTSSTNGATLMAAEPIELTLSEAAERLGVHYMTVYRHVRLGLLPAHKVGGTWRVNAADLTAAPTGAPTAPTAGRRAPWASRLRQRLLAGDAAGSWQLVESAMASGFSPEEVYVVMLAPALHAIGAAWERGDVRVDEEHLASAVAIAIVGRMGARPRRRGRHRGVVVVATAVGDRHGIGVSMVADTLARAGYEVLNLGTDTPPESLAAVIAGRDDVRAVLVSVVNSACLGGAAQLIAAARQHSAELPIIAGGFAIQDQAAAHDLGADGWTADLRQISALIEELSARVRPAPAG
ncbi:MAG: cobalamin-dependent protein [Chloroflexota bacterium]